VLTGYIKSLEEERSAAAAAAMLLVPTGGGEKRSAREDVAVPETKKRKVSQGVKALEKASKRGMKDMRSFFKKPVVQSE